jgi:GxxExxY protein
VRKESRAELDKISGAVVDLSLNVHTRLGPGLLEAPYRRCLAHELRKAGFRVDEEVAQPLIYDDLEIELAYKLDLVVNECVVVEVKSISQLLPVHEAQLLTYLRLTGLRVGLLINFRVARLRDGLKRLVNNY